jgi:hypothetical protein
MVDPAGGFLVGAKLTENEPIHFLFYNKNLKITPEKFSHPEKIISL